MRKNQELCKVCGMCGRISKSDLGKNWCPVTAQSVNYKRNADSCRLYIPKDKDKSSIR